MPKWSGQFSARSPYQCQPHGASALTVTKFSWDSSETTIRWSATVESKCQLSAPFAGCPAAAVEAPDGCSSAQEFK